MGNLKEIRLRISSVKNTRKITQAMGRIATARLVRAQQNVTAARPYGVRLAEVVHALTESGDEINDPLMTGRPEIRGVAIIVLTGDRGLCGAFNANAIKAAVTVLKREKAAGRQVTTISIGKKGALALSSAGARPTFAHEVPAYDVLVDTAKRVAAEATGLFLPDGDAPPRVDVVYLIYNFFKNALTQEVRTVQLLPFTAPELRGEGGPVLPLFEPDRATLLAHLLPVVVESEIQQALLNSISAELAARRAAMNSATDNASELIQDLTLQFNRERQAAITNELMEIIGGAEALKG